MTEKEAKNWRKTENFAVLAISQTASKNENKKNNLNSLRAEQNQICIAWTKLAHRKKTNRKTFRHNK